MYFTPSQMSSTSTMFSREAAGSTWPLKHNGGIRPHGIPGLSKHVGCQQCSLLDRGHDGDQRGQVSALSDPREHRAQPDLEGGQALGKHSDKVHGRAPGILQGWRNNLDIEQQKQAAQPSHFPLKAVFPAMGSLSYCPDKVIAEEPEL